MPDALLLSAITFIGAVFGLIVCQSENDARKHERAGRERF